MSTFVASAVWASALLHNAAIAMGAATNLISALSVAYRSTTTRREALMAACD
jgi:hypothetical protein